MFEKIIEDMKNDVRYALDKGWDKKSVMLTNRINSLIDVYNEQEKKIKFLEAELSAAEIEVLENFYEDKKMVERFFLIFDIIGITKADVVDYLRKGSTYLKQMKASSQNIYDFKLNTSIDKLFLDIDLKRSEYFIYKKMYEMDTKMVADFFINDFIKYKRTFGKLVN